MGMDLCNKAGDYFRFSSVAWFKVMSLAESYGWKAQGTASPDNWQERCRENCHGLLWDGDYRSNAGQWVTADDASAIAIALEKALPDIPDCLMPSTLVEAPLEDDISAFIARLLGDGARMIVQNEVLSPYEYFGGEAKDKVRGFIKYCHRGEFAIY